MLVLTTLAGFALRSYLLDRYPFREDEAIYGYWALYGWHQDPFFLHVWPDKPPVFVWLLTLAFQAWGVSPATARFLNIGLSTLTIPVLAVTARGWWGDWAGVAAALVAGLAPFAITFAPTAFTDPLLVLAGSLALALMVRRRFFGSGMALGVAIMTKQQGLLFVPLVVGAGLLDWRPSLGDGPTPRQRALAVLAFLAGIAAVVAPILYWDSLRWSVAPSPWDLGARNVGAVSLTALAQWGARLRGWLDLAWYLLASNLAWLVVSAGVVVGVALAARRRAPFRTWAPAVFLVAWAVGFGGLHVVTSVQIWDRYLLPLVAPLALAVAWAVAELQGVVNGWRGKGHKGFPGGALMLIGLLVLAPPAVLAAAGRLPVGGDHGAYSGIDEAFAYVTAASHAHSVALYQRELGWHARFYLYDALEQGAVDLRYYPSSVFLADSAAKLPDRRRLVIVPDWSPLRDLDPQLAARGLTAKVRLRAGHFTVYEISAQSQGDARWRVCRPRETRPALTAPTAGAMMCRP